MFKNIFQLSNKEKLIFSQHYDKYKNWSRKMLLDKLQELKTDRDELSHANPHDYEPYEWRDELDRLDMTIENIKEKLKSVL